jgi:hypothetical protein
MFGGDRGRIHRIAPTLAHHGKSGEGLRSPRYHEPDRRSALFANLKMSSIVANLGQGMAGITYVR